MNFLIHLNSYTKRAIRLFSLFLDFAIFSSFFSVRHERFFYKNSKEAPTFLGSPLFTLSIQVMTRKNTLI